MVAPAKRTTATRTDGYQPATPTVAGEADANPRGSMALIHNHTATSIAAAEATQSSAAVARQRILDAIRAAGIHGLTREEIEAATAIPGEPNSGIPGNTVRPRVRELIQRRLIEEAGEIRPTKSGEYAKVLTVVA